MSTGQRCNTITKLGCHGTLPFDLLKSSSWKEIFLFYPRCGVSWVTTMAATGPTLVFDNHPSCQSQRRTKAAKPRQMTSCLGSASYRRGLNTVQLAFCVWSRFFHTLLSTKNYLTVSLGARWCTYAHTHALLHIPLIHWAAALSQEWALRQGVTTGTAAGAESQS